MENSVSNHNPHGTRLEDLFEPVVGVSTRNRAVLEDASGRRAGKRRRCNAASGSVGLEPTDAVTPLPRHIHLAAQGAPHLARRRTLAKRGLTGAMPDAGENEIPQEGGAVDGTELVGDGTIEFTAAHPDSVRADAPERGAAAGAISAAQSRRARSQRQTRQRGPRECADPAGRRRVPTLTYEASVLVARRSSTCRTISSGTVSGISVAFAVSGSPSCTTRRSLTCR